MGFQIPLGHEPFGYGAMKHATRLVPRFPGRRLRPVQRSYRDGHDQYRVSLLGNGGVVSHRSAAELYGLGHLTADQHEFTVPSRRQTRRPGTCGSTCVPCTTMNGPARAASC
jgi:hypothetical protein